MDVSLQYKIAELKPGTVNHIYMVGQELRRETGGEIILTAYQKKEKSEEE